MGPRLVEILTWMVGWVGLGSVLLFWGHLSVVPRRLVAFSFSLSGLILLVLALGAEGQREASITAYVLATPYFTTRTSASASTTLYVLTALCLLLGATGLALTEETARRLRQGWLSTPLLLATLVAVLRFVLEKTAAPPAVAQFFGVTWMAPAVGLYLAVRARELGASLRSLALALVGFAALSRVAVVALYAIASCGRLGSHYDLTPLGRVRQPFTGREFDFVPGSLEQLVSLAVLPQFLFWAPLTLLAGLAGAGLTLLLRTRGTPASTLGRAPA